MSSIDVETASRLAAAALPRFGIAADVGLRLLKQRENFVFAANDAGRELVLRVHRRGYHSDPELADELAFAAALAGRGVAVPSFLPALSGGSYCLVGAGEPCGVHQVDIQEFIANTGNFGDEFSAFDGTAELPADDFRQLGQLLAQVHNATAESGFAVTTQRARWDADGLLGEAAVWGHPLQLTELTTAQRAILEPAMLSIRHALDDYGQSGRRFGPIHADATPENILRTPDGLVLIDFDDFASGWHLFDLATALFFYSRHPRAPQFQEALFAGYCRHRPLDAEDFSVFPALLLARGLSYLGWSAARRGEPTAEFHVRHTLPYLVEMAENFLALEGSRA